MLDNNGRVIEGGPEPRLGLPGEQRTYRLRFDYIQYRYDMNNINQGIEYIYKGFNIVMKCILKKNNFKAVLERIRESDYYFRKKYKCQTNWQL